MGKLYILVALALSGCEACETVANADGKVYDCGEGVEYCYLDGSADELSAMAGRRCSEAGVLDRLWPGLANLLERGCVYSCKPHDGCNAHHGCWCPAAFVGRAYYALWGAGDVGVDTCDSATLRPALYCGRWRDLQFDGCRWQCVDVELRQ